MGHRVAEANPVHSFYKLKEHPNFSLAQELGKTIIDQIGQSTINELDILKDDFNYTPN